VKREEVAVAGTNGRWSPRLLAAGGHPEVPEDEEHVSK
jgi:hypothetical protein